MVDYFNLRNFPNVKVLKTEQVINQLSYCIYFQKHSCLTKEFNRQIDMITSCGFIQIWSRKFSQGYRKRYRKDHIAPHALGYDQISGLIIVCVFMYLISCIIFVFELMSLKHDSIKRLMDFFTFKH